MLNRRHFLAQGAGTALATAAAFPSAARAATTASAPSDIALVREIVTTLHPGLYRYNSPKTIDQALSKLERDVVRHCPTCRRVICTFRGFSRRSNAGTATPISSTRQNR